MRRVKPTAILQMGDFAWPEEKNKQVVELFNSAHEQTLHVIGNHDTDNNHTHQDCVDTWGIPAPYYAKNINGYWLVVLNGNEKGSPTHKGGYPIFIGPGQTQWLKQTLLQINGPVIIACHQPIAGPVCIDNAPEIQSVISSAKDKVILVLNGHTHIDNLLYINEIPYLAINSASYFWVGPDFTHESYTKQIHATHPAIASTCPYKKPLFTTLTVNAAKGIIKIKGCKGEWMGKSPIELGFPQSSLADGREIVPFIRERNLRLTQKQVL
jgi:calcineurin-like phosphoesterase family protein